jgi:hypothetical protein
MRLTLELTPQAEAKLSEEAARDGLSIDQYAVGMQMEKIFSPAERMQWLAEKIAGPGYVASLSRESIYSA